MKDEIKEILDVIITLVEQSPNRGFYGITHKKWKQLLDYITNLQDTLKDREEYCYGLETQLTNLQEEVKSANESITWWQNRFNAIQQENERLKEIEKEHKNCTRKHWQQKCAEHCANEMIYKSRNEKAIAETKLGIQILEETKESYPRISCDVVINRYLKPILKSLGEDKDE